MPTAQGVFVHYSATQIGLHFDIDGAQYSYNATISPPIQPFVSRSVVLTYEHINQLSGSHSYIGQVGAHDFRLEVGGLEIAGTLEDPGIAYATMVNGSGTWESDA